MKNQLADQCSCAAMTATGPVRASGVAPGCVHCQEWKITMRTVKRPRRPSRSVRRDFGVETAGNPDVPDAHSTSPTVDAAAAVAAAGLALRGVTTQLFLWSRCRICAVLAIVFLNSV